LEQHRGAADQGKRSAELQRGKWVLPADEVLQERRSQDDCDDADDLGSQIHQAHRAAIRFSGLMNTL